ncbi:MAG: glycosyltransferase [Solirubrobacterales bacterium]|nr:glycosyltransferase [Solirubrobacterales bacterium]
MTALLKAIFWPAVAALAWTQIGYGALVVALTRRGSRPGAPLATAPSAGTKAEASLPTVTLIIAAHNEASVIAAKVANARGLDYPGDRLEVIVAADGCTDDTVARATEAGADAVLDLIRGGKVQAQDAGVRRASGEILAFSDANSTWEPGALKCLVARFEEAKVGYVCGQVNFINPDGGDNQEGLYWRYEMMIRSAESQLSSVTGGNGAIYATRRDSYVEMDPIMGHDLSFPFTMVKNGWRAVYEPRARATERMVPTVVGEYSRKRRMMSHAWPIVVQGGLARLGNYPADYAGMVVSHRLLRYASPFLHIAILAANLALVVRGARGLYAASLAVQAAILLAALSAPALSARPFAVARYYVVTTAAIAGGLWDWRRHGTEASWSPPEGTR